MRSRSSLLLGYAALLASSGVALTLASPSTPLDISGQIAWPVLVVLFVVSLAASVSVPLGKETHTVSFTEIPLVLGLFYTDPRMLALAAVSAVLLVNLAWRTPAVKLTVNVASWAVSVGLAVLLFRLIVGDTDPEDPLAWVAALVAVAAYGMAGGLVVETAIAIRSGGFDRRSLAGNVVGGLPIEVTNGILGLVGVLLVSEEPLAALLLVVLAVVVYVVYRGYLLMRQRNARLAMLYQFTSTVDRSVPDATVAETIGQEAARLMRAGAVCVMLRSGDRLRQLAGSRVLGAETWWLPCVDGSVLLLPRGRRGRPAPELQGTAHRDGIAVPLHLDERPAGALVVADRLDEVSTFDRNDLALMEALAGHASVTLANARLVEQVQVDARTRERLSRHDQLTGLLNRAAFEEQLRVALRSSHTAGVVLIDVDRFREVNDTLGHHLGDRLLYQVGQRVRATAGAGRHTARLGGDEFAVLSADEEPDAVERLADRILRAVAAPLSAGDLSLGVRASAGVATAGQGEDAAHLLRKAEIAMYDAKQSATSTATYSPSRDPYDERRLRLTAHLEQAIARGDVTVHYQPQVDISSRRVLGLEALARWTHPEFGEVSPDEFVPLAARAGLMGALTQHVLGQALSDCREWQRRGLAVTISVNVSMLNLREPALTRDVRHLLHDADLPSSSLVLEITESEIMTEPERSVNALHSLAALGLTLSVDDFGTGHTSLLHLRSLPIGEVKIDRAFVHGILGSPGDAAIIRSVIDLGHNLGMRVVAEGVESENDLEVLRAWRCDVAQGFLLAEPMPVDDASRWLTAQAG